MKNGAVAPRSRYAKLPVIPTWRSWRTNRIRASLAASRSQIAGVSSSDRSSEITSRNAGSV
jgi:hypothetical protein